MYRLGQFELHAVGDGFFRLDGGAMFGIVPKALWEKVHPPDDRNRITLSLTTFLIRTGQKNILVDTGIGIKHDQRFVDLYAVDHPTTVASSLQKIALSVDDIDLVILSHLHFDHAGGATVRDAGGALAPTFPKATYFIQKGMWAEALTDNPRTKGSYIQEDFLPLEKAGRVKFLNGDAEIEPGIRVWWSGGHVKHHQCVIVDSQGRKAIYWADLLPTANHVKPAWVMGYDLYPAETAALKEKMLRRVIAEEWLNVFEHDPKIAFAYVRDGYKVEPLERVSP